MSRLREKERCAEKAYVCASSHLTQALSPSGSVDLPTLLLRTILPVCFFFFVAFGIYRSSSLKDAAFRPQLLVPVAVPARWFLGRSLAIFLEISERRPAKGIDMVSGAVADEMWIIYHVEEITLQKCLW